jgi:hypothetical protein
LAKVHRLACLRPRAAHDPRAQNPVCRKGTTPGSVCDRPVSLVDLFGTLTDLCDLPVPKADIDSRSLVPLLRNPQAEWPSRRPHPSRQARNYAISTQRWRYIHYAGGEEELYDIETDPHEWTNLATKPEHAAKLAELRALAPLDAVPVPEVPIVSLPELKWHPSHLPAPPSKPDGGTFDVVFINEQKRPVELCWMTPGGDPKSYGQIAAAGQKRQATRPGAVWMVRDADQKTIGHFVIGDRSAKAIVPASRGAN